MIHDILSLIKQTKKDHFTFVQQHEADHRPQFFLVAVFIINFQRVRGNHCTTCSVYLEEFFFLFFISIFMKY